MRLFSALKRNLYADLESTSPVIDFEPQGSVERTPEEEYEWAAFLNSMELEDAIAALPKAKKRKIKRTPANPRLVEIIDALAPLIPPTPRPTRRK